MDGSSENKKKKVGVYNIVSVPWFIKSSVVAVFSVSSMIVEVYLPLTLGSLWWLLREYEFTPQLACHKENGHVLWLFHL